jgi:hypothetical protein
MPQSIRRTKSHQKMGHASRSKLKLQPLIDDRDKRKKKQNEEDVAHWERRKRWRLVCSTARSTEETARWRCEEEENPFFCLPCEEKRTGLKKKEEKKKLYHNIYIYMREMAIYQFTKIPLQGQNCQTYGQAFSYLV